MANFTLTECPLLNRNDIAKLNEYQYFIGYDLRKMHIHNTITSLEINKYSSENINKFFGIFDEYVYEHWSEEQLDDYEHYVTKFRAEHGISERPVTPPPPQQPISTISSRNMTGRSLTQIMTMIDERLARLLQYR